MRPVRCFVTSAFQWLLKYETRDFWTTLKFRSAFSGIAVVSSIAIPKTVSLSSLRFQVSHNTNIIYRGRLYIIWIYGPHWGHIKTSLDAGTDRTLYIHKCPIKTTAGERYINANNTKYPTLWRMYYFFYVVLPLRTKLNGPTKSHMHQKQAWIQDSEYRDRDREQGNTKSK